MSTATLAYINNIILLVTIVLNLTLGAYAFFKDRRNPINYSFGLLLFSVCFWIFSFLLYQMNHSPALLLFFRRLTPVGAALIAGYFLYFSFVFPKGHGGKVSLSQKLMFLAPGYFFAFISVATNLMISSVHLDKAAYPFMAKVTFGPFYKVFAIYFIAYFSYGICNLLRKYLLAQGKERLQIFYVLFGVAVSGIIGIVTSLALPLFGISKYFTLGPPFTLIMALFVAYAILVHKLLNIEDFLSQGTYFLAVVAAVVGTFFFLATGNGWYLPLYYITLGHLALDIIVYSNNRRNRINISYAALVFFTGSMIFNSAIYFKAQNMMAIMLGAKLVYVSAFLLMVPLVFFATYFPFERPKINWSWWLFLPIPGVLLSLLTLFSNLLVTKVSFYPWGRAVVFGPLFPAFAIYCTLYVGYTFAVLMSKHRFSSDFQKTQIRYIFFSFLIIGVPNFSANVIFPAWFNNYRLIEPALYFALPEAILVAYAVLRHRLMSVEIIIKKGFVYTSASAIILTIYALAVIVFETFFRQLTGYSSLLLTALVALLIAVLYQPLVMFFQGLTDRFFFRGRYDYQKTLREISQRIASVIRLEELTKLIVSSFVETMKVSEIAFLLQDKDKKHFRSVALSSPSYKKIEIAVTSAIASWLVATKDILVRDEIEDEINRQTPGSYDGVGEPKGLIRVRQEMSHLGISVWIPIISKGELIGIIALGGKLSGDVFSSEDIGLLSTLANQVAVALDNARLYEEVINMKDYNEEILQSMISGVMTVNEKGEIVTFNYMAEKISGRQAADVLGQSVETIWGKRAMITNVVASTLTQGKCYTDFGSALASPVHGLVPVAFSSTVLFDHQGQKIGVVVTIHDQTELKELEEKVRRADKLSALATMAAGMAHEIKNPLSSMKVLSQLLPKKFDDPEYRQKMSEILPREINRIDKIVESLLGFARATTLVFAPAELTELLEENLNYYEPQASAAGIKIVRDYAALPMIEVDRAQLSQVFSNLIINAIQAMPSGGQLKIETRPGKKVEGMLSTIKIVVADTGHGLPEETIKKLFDPFFTTKHGGTGLGLTISHSIVDGHQGDIRVQSQLGQGTVFTVTLPVSQGLV